MSKSIPCSFYLNGTCKKGENCKFSHGEIKKSTKKNSPCIFWFGMNGKLPKSCSKGDDCNYSHDSLSCSQYPCESYLKGKCKFGDKCYFSHDDNGDESKYTAAGIIVYKKIGETYQFFLIEEKIKETEEIVYTEPGGKKEPGENSINAAKREFEEETGIPSPPITADKVIKIPEFKYIIYLFKAHDSLKIETNKGKFMAITEDIRLHPRSKKVYYDLANLSMK